MKQVFYFLGIVVILNSCQSRLPYGTWYCCDVLSRDIPQVIILEKRGKCKVQYRGKPFYDVRYKVQKNAFRLQNDSIRWKAEWNFARDTLILTYQSQQYHYTQKFQKQLSQRKTIQELLPLLKAPTVEGRLLDLSNYFSNGDYVDSETLCWLVGISPYSTVGEDSEISEQRNFIYHIRRIIKQGDLFLIETSPSPLQTNIGYYGGKYPRMRQGSFDIEVDRLAYIQILPQTEGTLIKLHGVKIGKGMFMWDAPNIEIQQNILKILGLQLSICR
ncbi:MAG: hypothetical protein NZM38_02470 [Cytophagales bacterium]|nr:hypothetical protein [Cytophagales bacterium]MDW8383617.1 hypothetical protein [Flammeovirgaceae bacterium]